MPKATVIGKADEGNLQVRLDERGGDGYNAEDLKRIGQSPVVQGLRERAR